MNNDKMLRDRDRQRHTRDNDTRTRGVWKLTIVSWMIAIVDHSQGAGNEKQITTTSSKQKFNIARLYTAEKIYASERQAEIIDDRSERDREILCVHVLYLCVT